MKEQFGLYLILTAPVAGYEACAQAAVDCGVRYLQLRMKDAPHDEILKTAYKIRDTTRDTETRFIINDNIDVAMACAADGVHLGQNDESVATARQTWNVPGKIFGLSTHSMEQAVKALEVKPDYIGVGPVFPTQTKADADPALGIEEVGRILRATPITAVTIGGITPDNLSAVLSAGISNFCVVSAVNSADDPTKAIQRLQKIWESHGF